MAITNTILLKGLLGAVVCLGSASAAIANKDKIVGYFSKDKGKDKKGEGTNAAAGGATTTEGSQEPAKDNTASTDQKTAGGTGSDKAQTGEQGASTPTASTPGVAGSDASQITPAGGQGASGSPGITPNGDAGGGAPSKPAATNTGSTFTTEEIASINKKITDTLKLPDGCKFSESDSYTKDCVIENADKLKTVNFLGKTDSQDLTITETFSNLKLEIKVLNKNNEGDKKKYGNVEDKDLRFTFKDLTSDITIKKDANDSKPVVLKKGTDTEFEIYPSDDKGKLLRSWYPSSLGFKVGLSCTDEKCKSSGNDHSIKLFDNGDIKDIKLENGNKDKEIITITKDQESFNQGYKFNVTEEISGEGSSNKLTTGDYEIKYIDKKGWAFAKKTNAQGT